MNDKLFSERGIVQNDTNHVIRQIVISLEYLT